mmetsp:Transcript_13417/g.28211  ORF Transcript_13417/g.28211 Transcript_13417/m.28211 type:complete len:87 (-) Transcript_13417:88-348(-)
MSSVSILVLLGVFRPYFPQHCVVVVVIVDDAVIVLLPLLSFIRLCWSNIKEADGLSIKQFTSNSKVNGTIISAQLMPLQNNSYRKR